MSSYTIIKLLNCSTIITIKLLNNLNVKPRGYFLILMEHRLGIKNGPKIKIDEYFFVELRIKKKSN